MASPVMRPFRCGGCAQRAGHLTVTCSP